MLREIQPMQVGKVHMQKESLQLLQDQLHMQKDFLQKQQTIILMRKVNLLLHREKNHMLREIQLMQLQLIRTLREIQHMQLEKTSDKLSAIEDTIHRLLKESGISKSKFVGVGISSPGPLDEENGIIFNPPRFDLLHNTSICSELRTRLHIPVYLENDASCLAQFHYGKPQLCESENFLLVLVEGGIGSGIISGGKLLKGVAYFTSELGHTSINYRGKRCVCGNIGCLEAYASIPSLLTGTPFKHWKELIDKRLENQQAFDLINLELNYLATGIMNTTNIISIDTVVLAGAISYGADYTAPLLEEKLKVRSMRRDLLPLRVIPAISGEDTSILSAADIAFNRFLRV